MSFLNHKKFWLGICIFTVYLSFSVQACASSSNYHSRNKSSQHSRAFEKMLRAEIRQWHGTPYRWGGVSRRGVDCSGYVMRVYRKVLGIRLPRTTKEQLRIGKSVRYVRKLKTGDLIFFKIPFQGRHVGIYLGNGYFSHASYSRGVMISNIFESYWHKRLWAARRIL